MKYHICLYGNPVLREKAVCIASIDETIRAMTNDMLEIMTANNGAGLAAQQIGKTIQICTISFDPKYDIAEPEGPRLNPDINMPLVLINPVLVDKQGSHTVTESCLSIPTISAPVERALEITVSFLNLPGEQKKLSIRGFMARVIQHEMDHLNGMLFIDRVSPVKKISIAGKLKRLKKKTEKELGNT